MFDSAQGEKRAYPSIPTPNRHHRFSPTPFIFLLLLSFCAKSTVPHPGAVNPTDSRVYDLLLISEGLISEAEVMNDAGTLDANVKTAINVLIPAHNATDTAWKGFRDGTVTEAELLEIVPRLEAAVSSVQSLLGGR